MKNKDIEDNVLEAIDSTFPTKNSYVDNVIKITKEAFAAQNHFHSGELDSACKISVVKDVKEIEDFTDSDIEYCPYFTDDADESTYLSDIIDKLGLDAKKLIKRLESLGYKVTKK